MSWKMKSKAEDVETFHRGLFHQMPEEDAFAVLVKLMQEYRLRELFKPSMAELGVCMYKLEFFIQVRNSVCVCVCAVSYTNLTLPTSSYV